MAKLTEWQTEVLVLLNDLGTVHDVYDDVQGRRRRVCPAIVWLCENGYATMTSPDIVTLTKKGRAAVRDAESA